MIPRHGGLVPEMRRQAEESRGNSEAAPNTKPALPSTLTKYTIFLPDQLQPEKQKQEAQGLQRLEKRLAAVDVDEEVRLYSFLPSADCPTPPQHLYATMVDDLSRAAELYVNADNGYDIDEGTAAGTGRGVRGEAAEKREGRRLRRIPVKKGEPCRLTYTTMPDSESEDDASGEAQKPNWRLSSIALPEYEHLACAVISVPTATPAASPSPPAALAPGANAPLLVNPLARPIMELRCERVSSADGSGEATASRRGISASWLSEPTVKFNKNDWKSMDALDKAADAAAASDGRGNDEEAVERRWTDADGENGEEGDVARPRKKARTKDDASLAVATSAKGIMTALAQNRQELLRQKREAEEAALRGRQGGVGVYLASVHSSSQSYGYRSGVSVAPPSGVPTENEETEQASGITVAKTKSEPVTVPLRGAEAKLSQKQRHGQPTTATTASSVRTQPQEMKAAPAKSLDGCGRAVMHELRAVEHRQYASLKELEKLILRRLPTYESVALKMKDATRKQEAVAWFRAMQKELTLWLLQYGCTIDPTGMVTFPLGKGV